MTNKFRNIFKTHFGVNVLVLKMEYHSGVGKRMGENLEVVCAELSTLSLAVHV
jgi:hypothetical protein